MSAPKKSMNPMGSVLVTVCPMLWGGPDFPKDPLPDWGKRLFPSGTKVRIVEAPDPGCYQGGGGWELTTPGILVPVGSPQCRMNFLPHEVEIR